jgi:hypothetical protein
MDRLRKNLKIILMAFEIEFRQNLIDGFVIFGILIQPLMVAFMALWMLKGKGADSAIFVVVGSGMTGLWTTCCSTAVTASRASAGPAHWSRW